MASKVVWTSHAVVDLDQLLAYIAERSPAAAKALERRIHVALARLTSFPRLGRVADGDPTGTAREILVDRYVLGYRHDVALDEIVVLQIRHERRSTHGGETLHEPVVEYGA